LLFYFEIFNFWPWNLNSAIADDISGLNGTASKVKYSETLDGSTKYDVKSVHKNDIGILNKMVAHIVATLNLVKLSKIKSVGWVGYENQLEWRTPLGTRIATELTKFRDVKIGLISDSIKRVNNYKSRGTIIYRI